MCKGWPIAGAGGGTTERISVFHDHVVYLVVMLRDGRPSCADTVTSLTSVAFSGD